jgi:serine/threonine-protein kinase RsbW
MAVNVAPLRCSFAADAANIARARHAVDAFAADCGATPERREEIKLAVSEACANAVLHAYIGCPPGSFALNAHRDGGHLVVHVRDYGTGMRPNPDSPGLGMGLPIIGAVARRFEVVPCAPGTEVVMAFDLEADRDLA